jgi:PAS domain S-box-containing protein
MNPNSDDESRNQDPSSRQLELIRQLRARLATLDAENIALRQLWMTPGRHRMIDANGSTEPREGDALSEAAQPGSRRPESGRPESRRPESGRAETEAGQSDLLANTRALAASQAETREGLNDLLVSRLALAASQAETKDGLTDLRASTLALEASRAATREGRTDLRASEAALASSRAETKEGLTDLRASAAALASSRAETKEGLTDLRASTLALASSRAETREGLTDLAASKVALASSRAETKEGLTDLRASILALASSRAETREGLTDLAASNVALASSRAETRDGQAELLASTLALAEAMRKGEERFRKLVEAAPSALMMIDSSGRIEMVNAQTERLFGYTRSELLGAAVEMLVPTRSRAAHPGLRVGFFADPSSRRMAEAREVFAVTKDGHSVAVEIGLSPIETDNGTMAIAAIVDISNRVRLEAEMRQTLKMHAIGRVTAGVAHDFNNLLMVLGGSLEMLLESVVDKPAAAEWGQTALRATTRGKELTDRLLSFSRKQVLTPRAIMIDAFLGELSGLIKYLFEANTKARTELVIVPCEPGAAVLADHAQLETALINLAVNARHAINSGGCVRISAFETDADPAIVPPGHYTVISVADTGYGMDADTLAQACEPFFTTKGPDGTGLGLSMVQGFACQSGGDVHITSVVGEGTTVEVWLPSAREASEIVIPVAVSARQAGRVLLVDDAPDVLAVVSALLRIAGFDVTNRSSGDLALAELTAGTRFDAIVTDFVMPGMNGLDLLTRARAIDQSIMGMIITGFTDPELLSQLEDYTVLRKPFNRAELIETVRHLIATKYDSVRPPRLVH